MTPILTDSENIVIRELYRNPNIGLKEITEILNKERENWGTKDNRLQKKGIDVRSISKFKSLASKKIKRKLEELADSLRLDRTVQEKEERKTELLFQNGILIGFDFRFNRKVFLFYSPKDRNITVWQDHLCNPNCQTECSKILNTMRLEHCLEKTKEEDDTRNHYLMTIINILNKYEENKKNG